MTLDLKSRMDVLREVAAVARQGWLIPQRPAQGFRDEDDGRLVVFVHGIFASSGVWRPMANHLAVTGIAKRQLHFNFAPIGSVERHAERLAREIERVHPNGPVAIIAHSLGGLIARYYAQLLGGRLDTLVTMGTPHRGTAAARGWPLDLARDLSPGSSLLRSLESTRDRLDHSSLTSMVAGLDVLVPAESARLEGSNVVEIPWVGHHGLLYDRVAWDHTRDAFAPARRTIAPPAVSL